ncbi:MAG: dihydroneopterin aldolase [Alistipes sp.]|nr:dihydroneopterin aldolase [Alistipes sp.]
MIYEIRLSDMEFYAHHGCYETERKVGNRFGVDLTLKVECDGGVFDSDDLSQTVNYLEIYASVERQMAVGQATVEKVAANIVRALRREFPQICGIRCTVSKFAPPLGGKVGRVSITLEE